MLYGDGVMHSQSPFEYLKVKYNALQDKFPDLEIDHKKYVDILSDRLRKIHDSARRTQELIKGYNA